MQKYQERYNKKFKISKNDKKRFVNLCKKLYHIFRKQNKKDLQVSLLVAKPNRKLVPNC